MLCIKSCVSIIFRFYDGICQWEEGSQTPILHIGWAKPLVTTISRFDGDIRSQVIINLARDSDDVRKCAAAVSDEAIATSAAESNNNEDDAAVTGSDEAKPKMAEPVISSLEALTAACGEKILNPDFLLQGGGQPFADNQQQLSPSSSTTQQPADREFQVVDEKSIVSAPVRPLQPLVPTYSPPLDIVEPIRPTITLYSRKMKGIRDLLTAEKLNTQAISLQVTAQSQVQVGGKKGRSQANAVNYSAKRSRRQT